MAKKRCARLAICLAVFALLLAACGDRAVQEPTLPPPTAAHVPATPTPVPPTPTPERTPTPTTPSAQAILEAAAEVMAAVSSYRFDVVMRMDISGRDIGPEAILMDVTFVGDVQLPDRMQGRVATSLLDARAESDLIVIGDQSFTRDPSNGPWQESDQPGAPFDPADMSELDISEITDLEFVGLETWDQIPIYRLKGVTVLPLDLGEELGQMEADLLTDFWISSGDMRLLKSTLTGEIAFPATIQATATVSMTMLLSDFNSPIEIAAPEVQPAPSREVVDAPGWIVFTRGWQEGVDLFLAPASGSDLIQLTEAPIYASGARWSPDGSQIAYVAYDPQSDTADLWVLDPAAPDAARAVTTHGELDFNSFSWSPDGTAIVYDAIQQDGMENDIYRLELATGEVVNLTADSPVWDSSPAWSPDGEWIAFVSDRGDDGKTLDEIWRMRPDGGDLANLTANGDAWEDVRPAWSPDGSQIAFFRWNLIAEEGMAGGPSGLWIIQADGSEARLLYEYAGMLFTDAPVWSPDGTLIAFSVAKDGDFDVWVIPVAGGEAVNVSNLPGDNTLISWSPDSSALTFTNETEETIAQYVAAADGSVIYPLLPEGVTGEGCWSPVADPPIGSLAEPDARRDLDQVLARRRSLAPCDAPKAS